jgi:hypothetical protein
MLNTPANCRHILAAAVAAVLAKISAWAKAKVIESSMSRKAVAEVLGSLAVAEVLGSLAVADVSQGRGSLAVAEVLGSLAVAVVPSRMLSRICRRSVEGACRRVTRPPLLQDPLGGEIAPRSGGLLPRLEAVGL